MNQIKGLTLIEVLVALAIIAIAMTAVIKSTSQAIRATDHLQTKMTATWVAQLALNEIKVGLINIPPGSEGLKQKTTMLGMDWYWQMKMISTPNRRIKKVEVAVYKSEDPAPDTSPIVQLEGYLYAN